MPSTCHHNTDPLVHVAIIMDGNGRWALHRGQPRMVGHGAGTEAARRIVESAPDLGIDTLTLYAFSSDNWSRPKDEVDSVMQLLHDYLESDTDRSIEDGVRLNVIGRRDRIPSDLRRRIERSERLTRDGRTLWLRLAVDYSSRDAICRAAALAAGEGPLSRETFNRRLASAIHSQSDVAPDVDLLVRTGGEQRLSDFLLWECAYAELWFTPCLWPDFGPHELGAALEEFRRRDRRFGGLSESVTV